MSERNSGAMTGICDGDYSWLSELDGGRTKSAEQHGVECCENNRAAQQHPD